VARTRRTPRRIELKFRVRPLVRMPKSVMFQKLQEFASSGIAPHDLEVAYMEYSHGSGKKYHAGERIAGAELQDLEKFVRVLLAIQPEEVSIARRTAHPKPGALRVERPHL
jgi:hypothetical protein